MQEEAEAAGRQGEGQDLGVGAPEPIAASTPAAAANLGGSEVLDQGPSAEDHPMAVPTVQGGNPLFDVDKTGPSTAADVLQTPGTIAAEGVEVGDIELLPPVGDIEIEVGDIELLSPETVEQGASVDAGEVDPWAGATPAGLYPEENDPVVEDVVEDVVDDSY